MKMKYKLICIDVDGTLLNSHKEIPKENIEAINKAYESGVSIAIASGRGPWSVKELINEIGVCGYRICLNGAYVIDDDVEISKSVIDNDKVNTILDVINKYDVRAFFATSTLNITNKNLLMNNLKSVVNQKDFIVSSGSKLKKELEKHNGSILKVSIMEENNEIYKKVRQSFEETGLFQVEKSDVNYLDVNIKGINKSKGVKELARYLNIDLSEVICIGDNENDIDMIKDCGLGIAMANACKELIEISDAVTVSNDECGVAKAIYDYIIN